MSASWVLRDQDGDIVLTTRLRGIAEAYMEPGYTIDWEETP